MFQNLISQINSIGYSESQEWVSFKKNSGVTTNKKTAEILAVDEYQKLDNP